MKYGWSAEVDQNAVERLRLMGLATERIISERLAAGELADIDLEIQYVPIIMVPEYAQNYPARTMISHKNRTLHCAPQLDSEKFLVEPFEIAANEYVRGIIDCLPLLSRLRFASSEIGQIEEFFIHVSEDLRAQARSMR